MSGSGINNGNCHKAHDCPYCWGVYYSKGALTNHINNAHWEEVEKEEKELEEFIL